MVRLYIVSGDVLTVNSRNNSVPLQLSHLSTLEYRLDYKYVYPIRCGYSRGTILR